MDRLLYYQNLLEHYNIFGLNFRVSGLWGSVTFVFLFLKCHVEDDEAAYIVVELKL